MIHSDPLFVDPGSSPFTRRDFLRGTIAAGAGIALARVAFDALEPALALAAGSNFRP
jgi:hypothetical protein